MVVLLVVIGVAVLAAAVWWVDRRRGFRVRAPSADEELRSAEQHFEHEHWKNGPGMIGG